MALKYRLIFAVFLLAGPVMAQQVSDVAPARETQPITSGVGENQDVTVWLHPSIPTSSLVIGTDALSGLEVYDLTGERLQVLPIGSTYGVTVLYGFSLGVETVDLVITGSHSAQGFQIYRIDATDLSLEALQTIPMSPGRLVYGVAASKNRADGKYYVFVSDRTSTVRQLELFMDGATLKTKEVRTVDMPEPIEGLAVDGVNGLLYVTGAGGIWRVGSAVNAPATRVEVAKKGTGGFLQSPGGISVFHYVGGSYVVVSTPSNSQYLILNAQPPFDILSGFRLVSGSTVDAVVNGYGIDVLPTGLGAPFSDGLFVSADVNASAEPNNFKLVGWKDIAVAAQPDLALAPQFNPRELPAGTLPDGGQPPPGGGSGGSSGGTPGGGGNFPSSDSPGSCYCGSGSTAMFAGAVGIWLILAWFRRRGSGA